MKITAIESLQWAEYPRLLVVRVHTDSNIIRLGKRWLGKRSFDRLGH
jgi:hypothetical protein